jgi:hypothetical protein
MGWVNWRLATSAVFVALSACLWLLLDGFAYRVLLAALPVLFAAQIALTDALEILLISKVGFRTRWFAVLIAPGTVLHELCHLFSALATGCTITKAALFRPNPQTGVLGYVNYTLPDDKWLVFREFLIGFSPFFGCGLLLFAFNGLMGGGLLDLVDASPVASPSGIAELAASVASSSAASLGSLNFGKPPAWVFVYLQLCFTVGAAPSTVDFKGAFSSIWKHLFSGALFLAFLSLAVLASDQRLSLGGWEGASAAAIGACLKFTVIVLLLSICLTAAMTPIAYLGSKVMEVEGIAKTIPVTAGFLTYYYAGDWLPQGYAVLSGLFVLSASLVIFLGKKEAPKRKDKDR